MFGFWFWVWESGAGQHPEKVVKAVLEPGDPFGESPEDLQAPARDGEDRGQQDGK